MLPEAVSDTATINLENTSQIEELGEPVSFLKQEGIPYITVGSSVGLIYGVKVKPSDMDIIVLEQDELKKLQQEGKIDRFNDSHRFRIDDNLSRLGIVFRQKERMFVHSPKGVYVLNLPQPTEIGGIATLEPAELVRLAKSLVSERPDDIKANRLVANLTAACETIENLPLPKPFSQNQSPRDKVLRSPEHFSKVIGFATEDFERFRTYAL